jgi:phosphopantothenoylcysteine synthetase/decarboxylase
MKLLLGISGGIAAYRSAELVHQLARVGHEVRVVMTQSALQFVTPLTLATLSGQPVVTGLFGDAAGPVEHIELAQWPDLVLIAPATANVIGKVANGIADDMLSTIVMATPPETSILFAPAMNTRMWENPLVQANRRRLESVTGKYHFIEPRVSRLACGDVGAGAMAEIDTILAVLQTHDRSAVTVAGVLRGDELHP